MIFKKLINFLSSKFNSDNKNNELTDESTIDELVGLWENELDDSSGLHAYYGWSFKFNLVGTGVHNYWSTTLKEEVIFQWERINQSTIKVKFERDADWTCIEYIFEIVDGPYNNLLFKLTDKNYIPDIMGNEGFWDYYGAIFKYVSS